MIRRSHAFRHSACAVPELLHEIADVRLEVVSSLALILARLLFFSMAEESSSTTSHAAWTALEQTYVSPSHGRIMTHRQNLASPQQGNQTITDYMQDAKHNIDSLALMNDSVDFDELSIRVLNGLGSAYSHISHALQARDTPFTFEELFERLLSYEA